MEREGLTSRKQSSELQGVPTTQVSLQGLGTSKILYKNENCVGGSSSSSLCRRGEEEVNPGTVHIQRILGVLRQAVQHMKARE